MSSVLIRHDMVVLVMHWFLGATICACTDGHAQGDCNNRPCLDTSCLHDTKRNTLPLDSLHAAHGCARYMQNAKDLRLKRKVKILNLQSSVDTSRRELLAMTADLRKERTVCAEAERQIQDLKRARSALRSFDHLYLLAVLAVWQGALLSARLCRATSFYAAVVM